VLIEEIFALGAFALKAIREIVDSKAVRAAAELADAVRQVYAHVADATVGKITPEHAKQAIENLVARLRENDAAADAALDAKFPAT
jgi:DNA-directed RNA polymerase subunit F